MSAGQGLRADAGRALRECLEQQGRTQADVAKAIGCSQKHLSNALNDHAGTTRFMDVIARELGVELVVRCRPVGKRL